MSDGVRGEGVEATGRTSSASSTGASRYAVSLDASSVVTASASAGTIWRKPGVAGSAGSLYSLMVRLMVMRLCSGEKPTSMSFLGFNDRW